jgi:hypothetical protein
LLLILTAVIVAETFIASKYKNFIQVYGKESLMVRNSTPNSSRAQSGCFEFQLVQTGPTLWILN